MKLQFKTQDYQLAAVQAVVDAFRGQTRAQALFDNPLPATQSNASLVLTAQGIANCLVLDDRQLLSNVQAVQARYNAVHEGEPLLAVSDALVKINPDDDFANLSIEMETGTGKTYVFISTIHALSRAYGWKKFVIVVPSVAIREGTLKNLAVTEAHFFEEYQQRIEFKLYDSKNLSNLRHFSMADSLQVLVMSIDSFTKDNNVINTVREQGVKPIAFIQNTRPIVIIDEPQNFETDIRRAAITNLHPLCTLRYSATHKNPYNLLYSLNPVQAYDLGLVKQIEVDGITNDDNHNAAFIELVHIEHAKRALKVKVKIHVEGKHSVTLKEIMLGLGDDLYEKSNKRAYYEAGFVLTEIRKDEDEIEFSNGVVVRRGQSQGDVDDEVMKFQIARTVRAHFQRLKTLQPLGIKVLSLFFIDKVAHYRDYDAMGNAVQGKFSLWFEAAFAQYASKYAGLIRADVAKVHNGYFSSDKSGKGKDKKEYWTDTKGSTAKDDDTYTLIMKDKERLLSLDEPLQFIFSHSALREGWDNPNVFQICTLNETKSEQKKRQEIGRGLRLPVNQAGERIMDKKINVLTVIANESYEVFSQALQAEIEDETGVKFTRRIADARAKAKIRLRTDLSDDERALFQEIWHKINYQVRYSVVYDTQALVDKAVGLLGDKLSYPTVSVPKLHVTKAQIVLTNEGVAGIEIGADSKPYQVGQYPIPDVYAFIQSRVNITRSTVFAVLQQSGRLAELPINPQVFLDMLVEVLRVALRHVLVDGIVYERCEHRRYDMSLFDVENDSYLSGLFPEQNGHRAALMHTPLEAVKVDGEGVALGDAFACVQTDSDTERDFANDCNMRKDADDIAVRFFFKLPQRFKIPTPAGSYVPDWAMVIDKNQPAVQRVYFVAETKSTLDADSLRGSEKLKILYAKKYFEQAEFSADGVAYHKVRNMNDVMQVLTSVA
ncbi:MAG: DEAD/DEAH box helicase family protein [Sulfuriferula sp.]